MSTNDLGRSQSPAKHTPNAFSMLKKTAQDESTKQTPAEEPKPSSSRKHQRKASSRTPSKPPATASEPSAAGGVGAQTPEPAPAPTPSAPKQPAGKERATVLITLYLPLDLREMFRNQAKAEKLSHPMLAFTAIEVAYPHLAELLSHQVSGPAKTPQVSLFQRSSNQSRGRTTHTKAYGDLQFRITETNAGILDTLVDEFNAPSRSALITTAIRHYLDYPNTDDE